MTQALPEGLVLRRTTDTFDNETVPKGLLRAHRVAPGTWGRLRVLSGRIDFVFEDQADSPMSTPAGGHVVIPPDCLHHVVLTEPATFVVEFWAEPA